MSEKFKTRNAHILRDDLTGKAKSLSAMEYVKNGRQGDYIGVDEKYYLSEKAIAYINREDRINKKLTSINGQKSLPIMRQYDQSKNGTFLCVDSNGRIDLEKTGSITSRYGKGVETHGSNPFLLNIDSKRYRKLTPIECERLQTVPDNYTNHVSNTQRYKMLGNGWTVDVIAHIFSQIEIPVSVLIRQLDMFEVAA
jgi:site-specific DNA-cytosine methylase